MIPLRLGKKPHKYKAKPVECDGHKFDSTAEAARYGELVILQRAGKITELTVHPRYPIVINNVKVCVVEMDFSYRNEQKLLRVEDVKGMDTALSKLKRHLLLALYAVDIAVIKRRKRR